MHLTDSIKNKIYTGLTSRSEVGVVLIAVVREVTIPIIIATNTFVL